MAAVAVQLYFGLDARGAQAFSDISQALPLFYRATELVPRSLRMVLSRNVS